MMLKRTCDCVWNTSFAMGHLKQVIMTGVSWTPILKAQIWCLFDGKYFWAPTGPYQAVFKVRYYFWKRSSEFIGFVLFYVSVMFYVTENLLLSLFSVIAPRPWKKAQPIIGLTDEWPASWSSATTSSSSIARTSSSSSQGQSRPRAGKA